MMITRWGCVLFPCFEIAAARNRRETREVLSQLVEVQQICVEDAYDPLPTWKSQSCFRMMGVVTEPTVLAASLPNHHLTLDSIENKWSSAGGVQ